MKTIGLIGGMSWESTQTYYRLINQHVRTALGGLHSAKVVLYSVDFAEIEALQHQGNWQATAEILAAASKAVEAAGADFMVLCTNTMHKVAEPLEAAVSIPLLHIADATAQVLQQQGITCVGLLGTRFTMEQAFYIERLQRHGIEVVVPTEPQRERVHSVIYQELCLGVVKADAKADYLEIVASLAERGAQGVILGCTEIGLLIQQADTSVPLFDTTEIHAEQAVQRALGRG
ncbi:MULTISPECIES: aspartate/glutamate racemase family protein [unclassified Halomonas]|uniref:aspartate/glutamate racemase family protein n=1 Tax=unclassified Halomonas TaxID=2609666 RepID=UPI001EF68312|nr:MULTISPECIES: aspartate/glutamate racemase family protein [unclassified Halomonas]MCG7575722.1 aspartate/glutamate racemase family protein [Halomonas sp. MMH1-48]MCG7602784.1 aspartate/glutamate racemase family protein [Halomonas sp. MM17-34]MCG7612177.1 aspartate/glutamate racemase family protein [Halomonas sp. MM17-29]MCG7619058.1 aspartate/glutamate racemase family protein [Halomonas sp. DSH1-27]